MSEESTLNRRKFLKSATIVGGAVVGAAAGAVLRLDTG